MTEYIFDFLDGVDEGIVVGSYDPNLDVVDVSFSKVREEDVDLFIDRVIDVITHETLHVAFTKLGLKLPHSVEEYLANLLTRLSRGCS